MNQEWFEMRDVRRRALDAAAWIPLRASWVIEKAGDIGYLGYREEFFGVGSLLIPISKKAEAEHLGWDTIGLCRSHCGCLQDGRYQSAFYLYENNKPFGEFLVLERRGNRLEKREWQLNQDFEITLGLKRENDSWLRIDEGYTEVARIKRDSDGAPVLLEVRTSHLKDYLCARKSTLLVASYRSRRAVVEDATGYWDEKSKTERDSTGRWEGRVWAIHEGGMEYGEKWNILHLSRTDVDIHEDVPTFSLQDDEKVKSESWERGSQGRKLHNVMGEIWRREFIEPAETSPIVGDEKVEPTVYFITDANGKKENKTTLKEESRWLWFKPEVITALLFYRGGSLGWYTRDTGSVGCSPDYTVHFGINRIGLINVYATDIALLPDWQQAIWAGYNVLPEGGVSEELLDSQMKAEPAKTHAPEHDIKQALNDINTRSNRKLGFCIFKTHDKTPEILDSIHRFRACDGDGIFKLAKDLARLSADSIDAESIQAYLKSTDNLKSLKALEKLLASIVGEVQAKATMSPLFGIYDLRLADAHLPSKKIDEAFLKVAVEKSMPKPMQGYYLIWAFMASLSGIWNALDKIKDSGAARIASTV